MVSMCALFSYKTLKLSPRAVTDFSDASFFSMEPLCAPYYQRGAGGKFHDSESERQPKHFFSVNCCSYFSLNVTENHVGCGLIPNKCTHSGSDWKASGRGLGSQRLHFILVVLGPSSAFFRGQKVLISNMTALFYSTGDPVSLDDQERF